MTKPPPPENWRDLFDRDYHYPEDTPRGVIGGRRARRAWRSQDRQARREWVRDQYDAARREEPPSPVAVIAVALLLGGAVLGLALLAKTLLGPADTEPATATDPPSAVSESTAAPTTPPASSTPPEPSPTGPPPVSTEASASPEVLIERWATIFYTRDPRGREESYNDLLRRAEEWMTPELVANLSQAGDPTYEDLERTGTRSRVTAVRVTRPPEAVPAPADTPIRVSRVVRVAVALTPGGDRFDVPLLVELRRGEDGWLVGTIAGDGHHD